MDMASARRRGKPSGGGGDIVLWSACVLLCAISLLVAAVSIGFGAASRLTLPGEAKALVTATTTITHGAVHGRGYCGHDDLGSMSVEGEWVRDAERYPLYQPEHCPFIDSGFRCTENGRPDDEYATWRWRPRHCTLPRFDAARLLEVLRNRRLVFVGDSIGRNQWESMLCMLSTAVSVDKGGSVYEEHGNPISKRSGFLSFRFRDHNCTVEHFRSPYLVRRGRPPRRSPKLVQSTLQLAAMDARAPRWKGADVLVFNSGHWWNQERLRQQGCYFQDGKKKLRLNMSVEDAYQTAMNTLQKWIRKEVDAAKTLVLLRTYSPAHIRAKDSGGCATETSPELNTTRISLHQWPGLLNPALEASSSGSRASPRMQVLNVTLMTAQRRDGHPSVYNVDPSSRVPAGPRADCSHWCLPGVPDAWNELLYAAIVNRFS